MGVGQVRAGVIRRSEEFVGGANASEKIGDIKMYNHKVAFTIQGVRVGQGYIPLGGLIGAADVVRGEGQPGKSLLGEFGIGFDHHGLQPERYEIVNDGANGKAAVLRFFGKLQKLELLESYIKAFIPAFVFDSKPSAMRVKYEYILRPNSSVLEFRLTADNTSESLISVQMVEVGFLNGDGLQSFFPGKGFISSRASGSWPYYGLASSDVGYVFFSKNSFQVLIKYKSTVGALHEALELPAGEQQTYTWFLSVGRDLAGAQAGYHQFKDQKTTGVITGKVQENKTGRTLSGVEIHIEKKLSSGTLEYVGQAFSRQDGSFSITLPVGNYWLTGHQAHGLNGTKTMVTVGAGGEAQMTLKVPRLGTLNVVSLRQKDQRALPTKVMIFRRGTPLPKRPEHYRVKSYGAGATKIIFSHTGSTQAKLPPGRYRVVVSRGFLYTKLDKEYVVEPGQTTTVIATLQQVVETPGVLSADFHVHAKNSPDSNDTDTTKIAAMVSEGLDLAVSTDHEFLTDFQPTIDKMQLNPWVRGIVGEEITTYFGHFNAFPLPYEPTKVNNGVVWWYAVKAPELFKKVYEMAPNTVLQINHPRGAAAGAYFTHVGYDPKTGKANRTPKEWSMKFNAIEVVNGKRFKGSLASPEMLDWFSMLNRGHRIIATGNSDSHNAFTSECGFPRNYLFIGTSNPNQITPDGLAKTVKAGRLVVSGGAFIRFSMSKDGDAKNAVGLGEQLSTSGKQVHLHIRVEAAPWIDLEQVEVVANGVSVWKQKLAKRSGVVVRFDKVVPLSISRDSWFVVMTKGSKTLTPIASGATPFAFTNPIYVDADNNGKFSPLLKP